MLIPTRPLIVDLRTIAATTDVIKAVRLAPDRAVIVLNQVRASSGFGENSLTVEARGELAIYGFPVAAVAIGYRAALADALIDGRAVTEFDPHSKAAEEIGKLFKMMESSLWPELVRG